MAYNLAIQRTGHLIPGRDSQQRRHIYSMVDRLIELREIENKRFESDSDNRENYENHLYVIKMWKKFKH